MTIYELAKIKYPLSGIRRRAFITGAKVVLDELEMTLSVSEDVYLRSNLEKLIKEFKNDAKRKTELIEMSEVDGFWTEEDEKYIDNCCLLIGAADDCYGKPFKDDCIHYLQSLKQRML